MYKKTTGRRIVSLLLCLALLFAFPVIVQADDVDDAPVSAEFVPPERMADGKPIYDGASEHQNPEYVRAFAEYIIENDMDDEDLLWLSDVRQVKSVSDSPDKIRVAGRIGPANGNITYLKLQAGYEVPLFFDGSDSVFGYFTEFPAHIGVGQSWNNELSLKIGEILGNERRSDQRDYDRQGRGTNLNGFEDFAGIATLFTAVADMRINPLSGRFDEGFSEDPYMAKIMVERMAAGASGVDLGDDDDTNDFWLKAPVQNKHYSIYNAQWFRTTGSNNVDARSVYEYHTPSFLFGLSKGSLVGVMTSYGRTNGVPNSISPLLEDARKATPYGTFFLTDWGAPSPMVTGYGNGFDTTYVPDNAHMSAVYAKHEHPKGTMQYNGNAGMPSPAQTKDGINRGLFGVNIDDLKAAVQPILEMYVRLGYFSKPLDDGTLRREGYGFNDLLVGEAVDAYTQAHKDLAYQAAVESTVLLKNDKNLLPLKKEGTKTVVSGPMSETRYKSTYGAPHTPAYTTIGDNTGLTPLDGIRTVIGNENTIYNGTQGKTVVIKSLANGNYMAGPAAGGTIAVGADRAGAEEYELYALGQQAYWLRSKLTGKWVAYSTSGQRLLTNNTEMALGSTNNGGITTSSTMPSRFRIEKNADGSTTLVANGVPGNESTYYTGGRFVQVAGDAVALASTTLSNPTNAATRNDDVKFDLEVVSEAGANIDMTADYAVVVIGAPTQHSSGEGRDRSDLAVGKEQYELVENVAAKYPGKTVVVVKANYPIIMEEIQNNPNVAAILFQPYAGQADGIALADVIYGNAAPTGHLTSTWYANMSALPEYTAYTKPEGLTSASAQYVDPAWVVDYTNASPIESKLTYMYTDADVTYDFGFGLNYSEFALSNLNVPSSAASDEVFEVTVDLKNMGDFATSEVVQLYAVAKNPAYGSSNVPKLKLASYDKVFVNPGETVNVALTVDPVDFALYDVNLGELAVERGLYDIVVGRSSADPDALVGTVNITGNAFTSTDLSEVSSVWEHTFVDNDLVYREVSKERSINGLPHVYAIMSTGTDSYAGIPLVNFDGVNSVSLRLATTNKSDSTVFVRLDAPDGDVIASVTFSDTGINYYMVPSNDDSGATLKEAAYELFVADLTKTVTGVHDLYLTFDSADLRVDEIQLNKADVKAEVTVNPLTIAEDCAANVVVSVASGAIDGTVKVYLTDNDGNVYGPKTDAVINDGNAIIRLAKIDVPDAGDYLIAAETADGTRVGTGNIEVLPYDVDTFWKMEAELDDNNDLTISFKAPTPMFTAKIAVAINDTKVNFGDMGSNTLLVTSDLSAILRAPGTNKIVVSGVKFPTYFPSYSFTFTGEIILTQPL